MKLIALDVGTKRIGVAKADTDVRVAVPYSAIEVDGDEFNKIASLARAWAINRFVIGLPRNSQGEETKQSAYVRKFAQALKQAIPEAKVCFQDESLTSVEAEKRLKNRKKGYKKGDIDSEAAAIILQDFLEEHVGASKSKPKTKAAAAKHKTVKAAKPHRFFTILLIIMILLAAAGAGAFAFYQYNLQPMNPDKSCESSSSCPSISFAVADGASVNTVAVDLQNAGVIRNAIVFQIYYRINYSDATIKPGDYTLTQTMSPDEIVQLLSAGDADVFSFTIIPGETLREVREKLASVGYTESEIEAGLSADYSGKSYSWVLEGRPDGASLEGYLFGDTYEFYADDTVETVIGRMITELADVVETNGLKEKFAEHGLNLYQGITLASIVQKEANNATDYARVAQVFYNRLSADMTLGSDVTTQYAVDLVDPNREVYTDNAAALEIDSPYNTRKHKGLPYGPISNPGAEALIGAATPDAEYSNYLFFLTGDDGMMYYSDTEEGHNQNIQEYCHELCNVAL